MGARQQRFAKTNAIPASRQPAENRRHGRLDRRGDREQAAIGTVLADQHEADRSFAAAMTRNRDRAAVEEIGDRRVAQHEKVDLAVGVIGHEIGDRRGRHRHGGHHQRVIGGGDRGNATDEIRPRVDEIDVVGGVLLPPAQETGEHARIVLLFGLGDQRAMDGVRFGRGQPALGVDLRELGQFAQRDIDDARAGFAQRGQGGIERARHRRFDAVEHHGLRHRQPQPVEREGRKIGRRLARENRIEHGAASDRRRQRPDRIERGRERKRALWSEHGARSA